MILGFQKWIGYSDVKSMSVYFYVQRNSTFNTTETPITFDTAKLNIGGAMDLSSGIFTAPLTGTYFFSFTGIVEFPTSSSIVLGANLGLYLNGNLIGLGSAEDANTGGGQNDQLSLHSTLYLETGDEIWVQIQSIYGTGVRFYDSNNHYTHFNGWLLEENISQSL